MRWRQFFTPVESLDADQARSLIDKKDHDEVAILDVRQPGEYEAGHIPGATLIPLTDLDGRLDELDKQKETVVYCAIGGRSRVAAQMLAGRGFSHVYNLRGGFRSWSGTAALGDTAFGGVDRGVELFAGSESLGSLLVVAYSLEQGLRDFYLGMIGQVNSRDAKDLFRRLADMESDHQEQLFQEYLQLMDTPVNRDDFEHEILADVVEGGLTTEEYLRLYAPDLEKAEDVVGLAMAIEAQALDLYLRAADNHEDQRAVEMLSRIAREERSHLKELGALMDSLG
ncbi:MAG: sulfurtransferase [Deltaproteobacteria bacterium]|nr:sulfurtransferase [Candidatus Anaeroferrophillus wilburensis]MBN2887975.1 sulfurtransferase [Deltaproteobacteria bacterium]